jgi:hypothetical protein
MPVIELVKPEPNSKLIEEIGYLMEQAKSGEIVGLVGVKLRPDNHFACLRVGDCSDLELAGALAFATHDLIAGNKKK